MSLALGGCSSLAIAEVLATTNCKAKTILSKPISDCFLLDTRTYLSHAITLTKMSFWMGEELSCCVCTVLVMTVGGLVLQTSASPVVVHDKNLVQFLQVHHGYNFNQIEHPQYTPTNMDCVGDPHLEE